MLVYVSIDFNLNLLQKLPSGVVSVLSYTKNSTPIVIIWFFETRRGGFALDQVDIEFPIKMVFQIRLSKD